jgi:hypothetical protein
MKAPEGERRDWLIVLLILLFGFLCILIAGQWALRFAPRWSLNTDMESGLDPNSAFLTRRPGGFIEPIDSGILTPPAWIDVFLTPGAIFPTRAMPLTSTSTSAQPTATFPVVVSATGGIVVTASPTNTSVFLPPPPSSTPRPPRPRDTATSTTVSSIGTSTPTFTPSVTFTVTSTSTTTSTSTATFTVTPTNTSTNTPTPVVTDPLPPQIGTTPDGTTYDLPAGGTLTLAVNIVVNGHPSWDLVYYELPMGSGILLDWVIIEIGDGNNWYTIFNWGNNIADTNSIVDFNILSNPQTPPEPDERDIPSAELYNSTGVAINLDGVVPPGTYTYLRFTAPIGDTDGQMEIDAIEILP